MDSFDCAKQRIRKIIARSSVPEEPLHAENTLKWLLMVEPKADPALQIAAYAHEIDRAVERRKVHRSDFKCYEAFKAAHARNGARILRKLLCKCHVADSVADETCRLVTLHEIGGDSRSDLLKDADSISFFEVNLPFYFKREGAAEARRRCSWGYRRLSLRMKKIAHGITYEDEVLTRLKRKAIFQAGPKE
jgi:hypothetical protein